MGEESEVKPVEVGEIVWNEDGSVSIETSTSLTGNIEYQVNATAEDGWQTGPLPTNLGHGDKLYVRVNDGTTATEPQEIEIKDTIKPEEFTITVSEENITHNSIKIISEGTQDKQTGIRDYSFVVESERIVLKEIIKQNVTERIVEDLNAETEYVVYMLAYDNAGNVRKSNEVTVTTKSVPVVSMIGQPVNYSANDITDWKVFYGYDGGEIFLIKSNYLNKSKIPSEAMMTSGSNQRAYWTTSVTYDNIIDTDTTIRTRFLMSFNANKTNYNIKCVSKLLNTTTWSAFANGTSGETQITGGFAIGSPTLEMFAASWNSLHSSKQITIDKTSSNNGFSVSYPALSISDLGIVYRTPNTELVNGLNGYFIATPATQSGKIWAYGWGSATILNEESVTNCSHTARPVVSIPATYKLQGNSGTNMYDIVEK